MYWLLKMFFKLLFGGGGGMIWSNPLLVVNPSLGFHYLTSLAWSASTIRQYYLISYRLRHEALDFAFLHLLSRPWGGTAIVWTVFSFLGVIFFPSWLLASTFSFFVGLTNFFRLKASLSEKCQKVSIYWVPFSLFPTQLRWEETQSPKRGWVEVFDEKFSGSIREMDKRFLIRYWLTSDTTIQS